MSSRPRTGVPQVGDEVRILHLAGPEDAVVVAVEDEGRRLQVAGATTPATEFRLRQGSGLYVDARFTRLAFGDP